MSQTRTTLLPQVLRSRATAKNERANSGLSSEGSQECSLQIYTRTLVPYGICLPCDGHNLIRVIFRVDKSHIEKHQSPDA